MRRPAATAALAMAALATSLTVGPRRVAGFAQATSARIPVHGYTVVRSYPHDRQAFTQGLQYRDGVLYEGTGQKGQSSIRRVRLETGEVLQRRIVPAQYFGEGIVLVGNELFQLTWQEGIAFVYDATSFGMKRSFSYRGEGWGLTFDGESLVMSDGTDQIRFLDPKTFAERGRVRVTAGGSAVRDVNELEMIKGEIWANVWMTDRIARIDPKTGRVTAWVDLSGLLTPDERRGTDVLNGIAWDAAADRIFVTGKWWPKLFEIRVVER